MHNCKVEEKLYIVFKILINKDLKSVTWIFVCLLILAKYNRVQPTVYITQWINKQSLPIVI